MKTKLKIIYIAEYPADLHEIADFLTSNNLKVEIFPFQTFPDALKELSSRAPDLIISDYQIRQDPIFDHLDQINCYPWIVLTGHGGENIAVQALKQGAVDYVVKDDKGSYLPLLLEAVKIAPDFWNERHQGQQHLQKLQTLLTRKNQVLDQSTQRLAQETEGRVKAQQDLKESREIYRNFFQTSRDAVFIASDDGRWIDLNQSALKLFGYQARDEIWQESIRDVSWSTEQQLDFGQIMQQHGQIKDHLVALRRKNGSRIDALISATAYQIGGEVIGYQGFIRDVSGELEVRQQQQKTLNQQVALDQLSQELAACLTPVQIYQALCGQIRNLFPLEIFYAWKPESDQEQVSFQSDYSWIDPEAGKELAHQTAQLDHLNAPELQDLVKDHSGMIWSDGNGPGGFVGSMMAVPIVVGKQLVAVLQILHAEQEVYSLEEYDLLLRIANLTALGLQKAYLYLETKDNVDRLNSLQRIQAAILENLSLPTTLDMLMDQLVRELDVDAADILYLHPQLGTLKFITQTGFRQNILQHTDLEIGEGLAGIAAEQKKTLLISNLKQSNVQVLRELEIAAEHFLSYCGTPLVAKGRLVGVLELFHRSEFHPDQSWLGLVEMIAGMAALAIDHQNLYNKLLSSKDGLDQALDAIIEGWAQALELRGIESAGHWHRVQDLALRLGKRLGLKNDDLTNLRRGVLLHDIGKMGIPDQVLQKEGELTADERKLIGKHPVYAYELLKDVEGIKPALDIPLYHHERWDGTGYPNQLAGEEIPYLARIFSIIDVWDALLSDRPYRGALTYKKALNIMETEAGMHFDPEIVPVFLEMVKQDRSEFLNHSALTSSKKEPA